MPSLPVPVSLASLLVLCFLVLGDKFSANAKEIQRRSREISLIVVVVGFLHLLSTAFPKLEIQAARTQFFIE